MRNRLQVALMAFFFGLLPVAMLIAVGCASRAVTTSVSSTQAASQTTSSSASTMSAQSEPTTPTSEVRIGVMIPADFLYNGVVYSGGSVSVAGDEPADFSLVGYGFAADETGRPIAGTTYDIYAIKGIDQKNVIAVKFQGVSDNRPVWVWLQYLRKK